MLILLHDLPRVAAAWSGETVPIGVNPDVIDQVTPTTMIGYDKPVCQVTMGDMVRFMAGDVDRIMALVNSCYDIQPDVRTFADIETPKEQGAAVNETST